MTRTRLDQELVRRDHFPSRSAARNAINAGFISVEGIVVLKPAMSVAADTEIVVSDDARDYVGRGAYKLAAALDEFAVEVSGTNAIDVGASTGGFTQVLLDAGAGHVVALDVGRDQLHQRLREDPRVRVVEGVNVRDADPGELGGPFDVVTADLSFISLCVVARDLERLGGADADWIVLVKPQFEVGRDRLGKDGVVRDPVARGEAVWDVVQAFRRAGLVTVGARKSPLPGGTGNLEALVWMRRRGGAILSVDAFKVLADE
jgi:23S rRNA (cytidine1920-2'-O)/16S rRNA (cytidine1409-2'-O)-methyltransferase